MDNQQYKSLTILLPIIIAISVVSGIYIGIRYTPSSPIRSIFFQDESIRGIDKINELLNYVEESYVDTINRDQLVEKSMNDILQSLDPHSYYIPAERFKTVAEDLEGNFDGIGVEFRLINDTVVVLRPLEGGPSKLAGILAGDRIVKVDTMDIAGRKLPSSKIMEMLKGPSRTEVKLLVYRSNTKELLNFNIIRGKIPLNSVEASYLIEPHVAYIKINRFARSTYQEFLVATDELLKHQVDKLILDLRGNPGGFLDAATKIADEFLGEKKLIVYTEGKARPKSSFFATDRGRLEHVKVVILINENSASASEILAGAIQDNDRGVIIGRRSFGKGLVQEQLNWPDGSAIRLTVAKYYTPTGRSIQKPYDGDLKEYNMEAYNRLETGELQEVDSSLFRDSLRYYTAKGKVVYGGGGIMPDIFVPIDTSGQSAYYSKLIYNGVFSDFTFLYVDRNRERLNQYPNMKTFVTKFVVGDQILNQFKEYCKRQRISFTRHEFETSKELIVLRIKTDIAQLIWGNEGYYYVNNRYDPTIKKALEELVD